MRILYLFLFSIFSLSVSAQFSDDFSDGDFTSNPVWSGDDALFTVSSGELQSQSPGAATYYLSTPSTLASTAEWEFYFDFQFSTSGANYADIYLMSDVADLNSVNDGYFVRLGGTPDEISLYKMVSGTPTILIDGVDGLINSSSSNPFNIKVSRDASDNWTLQYDDLGSSPSGGYISAGTINDNSVNSSAFFGLIITQSSAASAVNSHFFDNFNAGIIVPDTDAPTLVSTTVISSTEVDVLFNEALDLVTSQVASNYSANNSLGNPTTAIIAGGNPALIHLTFATAFTNGTTNTLTVSNVEDALGNAMTSEDIDFTFFVPDVPSAKSIVINELFPDPSPIIGLPEAEYIELFNATTDQFYDLEDWTISDGSSTATLPSKSLFPGEYLIICDSGDEALFAAYPNVLAVSSFPSLNNGGDSIALADNTAFLVDDVVYTDGWYQDSDKDGGGYSLELINPFSPCGSANNWRASEDASGGTPGVENSVYDDTPDVSAPTITSIETINDQSVLVHLSEPINTDLLMLDNFSVSGGISVSGFTATSTENTQLSVDLSPALDTGILYTLDIDVLADCSGNSGSSSDDFVLPFEARNGDIIINEILFDPYSGGSDFVELYNNSNRAINLQGLFLANEEEGEIDNEKPIENYRIIQPGEFVVVSKDTSNIKANYLSSVPGTFIKSNLPTYSNDEGVVHVLLSDSTSIDRFAYDNDMHFKLIKDDEGKSLERIDYNRPTDDETNWHTAAESVGFATPGRENSQFTENETEGEFSVSPEIFSPDNDGYEDVVTFSYVFNNSGLVGNAYVYDSEGRLIRYLIQNEILGTEGSFSWDGINDSGEKGRIGAYILVFETYDLNGSLNINKKTFVLGSKL